ncbi:hypothetical protein, partial [Sulfurimonas sp.]|uniref:hypothetical protein n=1 Tax=Sulfurimonas sp. TaxID=2022749 RepID=UPI003D0AAA5E
TPPPPPPPPCHGGAISPLELGQCHHLVTLVCLFKILHLFLKKIASLFQTPFLLGYCEWIDLG